jgi:hypothetical protein
MERLLCFRIFDLLFKQNFYFTSISRQQRRQRLHCFLILVASSFYSSKSLLKHEEFQWLSLTSFDNTWSTFAFRLKSNTDKKRETKPKERPISDYIEAQKKVIHPPHDLAAALKKNKKVSDFFQTLSFTTKKEYIEWIVTAKREETKKERIKGAVEKLEKQWKNLRNV